MFRSNRVRPNPWQKSLKVDKTKSSIKWRGTAFSSRIDAEMQKIQEIEMMLLGMFKNKFGLETADTQFMKGVMTLPWTRSAS